MWSLTVSLLLKKMCDDSMITVQRLTVQQTGVTSAIMTQLCVLLATIWASVSISALTGWVGNYLRLIQSKNIGHGIVQ